MNGTNRQAEGGKKHETEQSTPMRTESAKKFCATWMGMTIGFAFMMSSIDVHISVGMGIVLLTGILSRTEKNMRECMGRFLLALLGVMGIAIANVCAGSSYATKYPRIQTFFVAALAISWIVGLAFDYRRWKKQSEPAPREPEVAPSGTMIGSEHGKKNEAEA